MEENTKYICQFCGNELNPEEAEERELGLYLHCDKCNNDNILAEYEV